MEHKNVSKQNYDIIFKAMTEQFGKKALDFYGIYTAPIIKVESTDLPLIEVRDRRMDFVFALKDESLLHLEFQTQFHINELERFKLYDTALYEKKRKLIKTFVIYGSDVNQAEESLDHGSIRYHAKAIYMKDFDGDAIFYNLTNKILNREILTDEDQLKLIFLPLMKTQKKRSDLAAEVVELAKRLKDEEQRFRLMATSIAIGDKYLDDAYINKMMEVLRMTRVFRRIYEEGEQEGMQEGLVRGKKEAIQTYMESRFGMVSIEINEKINRVSEIDVLNALIANLYKSDTIEQAEQLIDIALKKQNVS
ncbi:hypothetical protein EV207_12933 [Scopulibacillus darangshiensis]|uniref:Uncharacterized protein n=1 Tax=Scopulibacillus darangshiensis TaxID=442528 RepID=A0A4R2NQZ8_9BACL|nr:hypothetical protein [Scopulibacillus darangshiensis]TCP23755.1 hypothetical protein EV207_12933 [Scopulibacillus darangshiensis]